MLDDLRQLMKQSWRRRGRVYLVTAGALTLAMTAFGFDPVGQAAGGASLWLAFSMGSSSPGAGRFTGMRAPLGCRGSPFQATTSLPLSRCERPRKAATS